MADRRRLEEEIRSSLFQQQQQQQPQQQYPGVPTIQQRAWPQQHQAPPHHHHHQQQQQQQQRGVWHGGDGDRTNYRNDWLNEPPAGSGGREAQPSPPLPEPEQEPASGYWPEQQYPSQRPGGQPAEPAHEAPASVVVLSKPPGHHAAALHRAPPQSPAPAPQQQLQPSWEPPQQQQQQQPRGDQHPPPQAARPRRRDPEGGAPQVQQRGSGRPTGAPPSAGHQPGLQQQPQAQQQQQQPQQQRQQQQQPPPSVKTRAPRERPAAEQQQQQVGRPVVHVRKLLGGSSTELDIYCDAVRRTLSESCDFTVIGVCGPPRSGKSSLANDVVRCLLEEHGEQAADLIRDLAEEDGPFRVLSDFQACASPQPPSGIEMAIVPLDSQSRVLVLDCQALLGPQTLYQFMQADWRGPPQLELASPEQACEHVALSMLLFLLGCCHSVVYTIDADHLLSPGSPQHLMLLQAACCLQPLSASVAASHAGGPLPGDREAEYAVDRDGARGSDMYLPLPRGAGAGGCADGCRGDLTVAILNVTPESPLASEVVLQHTASFVRAAFLSSSADWQPPHLRREQQQQQQQRGEPDDGAAGDQGEGEGRPSPPLAGGDDAAGGDAQESDAPRGPPQGDCKAAVLALEARPPPRLFAAAESRAAHRQRRRGAAEGPGCSEADPSARQYARAVRRLVGTALRGARRSPWPTRARMSERDWLQAAGRQWDHIYRRSGYLAEYMWQLQQLRLY